jgi:xanthine dehydrogenase accessory factor
LRVPPRTGHGRLDDMKDLLDEIDRWRTAGRRVAVARVVDTDGSGPREPGAAMAVNEAGEVIGSVSGGCVEGAVVTEALSVLAGERPPGVITFGYSDDEAFAVGLTCGGTVRLFVEELNW